MIFFLERVIRFVVNLLILIVFIDSLVSFFLTPYHPVRRFLDRIVTPFLNPIRRYVPSVGGFDLSPLILIILIEIISFILIRFLSLL